MQATKRRRVEIDPRGGYVPPGNHAYAGQPDQYLRSGPAYAGDGHDDPAAPAEFSLQAPSIAGADQNRASTATLGVAASSSQQWDAPLFADPYADSTALAQQQQQQQPPPYFSGYGAQSTDPSTYNSPWPPQPHTDGFAQQQGSTYGASVPGTMPYLGSHDAGSLRVDASLDGAVDRSLQGNGHGVEKSADYSYAVPNEGIQRMGVSLDEPSAMGFDDGSMQLKNQSLPALDNLATQLIQTTAKVNLPQIQEILQGSETEEGQAYETLKSLFEQTRKVYGRETPFIDAIAIQMFQPSQQEIIRKANIATFVSCILGAHDVSFFHLNEYFMETFVPLGHRLLKWQGAIYLELKTQAYISALINSVGNPSAMLDELFPPDLDAQVLTRHPDAPSLSPSEQDFLDRCRARKSYLLAESNATDAHRELPQKYRWTDFVREFAACIGKTADALLNSSLRTQPAGSSSSERCNTLSTSTDPLGPDSGETAHPDAHTPSTKPPQLPTTTITPTQPSRQPWTPAEEAALLSGLAQVNGPHWSQILALYGRGGSVSEVLKARNQVQLKDKARNLKVGYLKVGREVPECLAGVTGELKKRGGKGFRARVEQEGGEGEDVEGRGKSGGNGSGRRKTKKGG